MLGQFLVSQRFIEPGDLNRALSEQLTLGLRLVSTLVALELLPLGRATVALSRLHGVPGAGPADFAGTDQNLIAETPGGICDRYAAFPLRLEGQRLHVAVLDPQRLDRTDELAFTLGRPLQVHVAPEILLTYHLERRYGIHRSQRILLSPPGWDQTVTDSSRPDRPVGGACAEEHGLCREAGLSCVVGDFVAALRRGLDLRQACQQAGLTPEKGREVVTRLFGAADAPTS